MPRVTVIIATYNWCEVLPYSIGSVLRQSFTDLEVLVVGDGCTDDSGRVVESVGDPRVRWINLPVNHGHQSAPHNEGLRQAAGSVVAYLGHDDLWLPHHLEASVAELDGRSADLTYSLVACVGPDGAVIAPSLPRPGRGVFSPPSGILHRRSLTDDLGGWRDHRELHVVPEVELCRRAASAGCRLSFVPRLTVIKFPAAWRKNVYRSRPSHEQAEWLARIDGEPDLEARLLSQMIVERPAGALPYSEVARDFARETLRRFRPQSVLRWRRGGVVAALRSYKGL